MSCIFYKNGSVAKDQQHRCITFADGKKKKKKKIIAFYLDSEMSTNDDKNEVCNIMYNCVDVEK